ncbi:MAG: helix-turn-helix domain-containing protein [Bacteroidetes bacterium]|nr:helix-turn-helix domain-containing protein [Bacteroidota bacterium]
MNIYRKKRSQPNTGREKLVLDVRPLLAAKGIANGYTYLHKVVGLPTSYAKQLSQGKAYQISNKYMEALCVTLNCTPNHLYHYTTPPTETIGTDHALAELYRPSADYKGLLKKLEKMSPQELEEFYKGIEK